MLSVCKHGTLLGILVKSLGVPSMFRRGAIAVIMLSTLLSASRAMARQRDTLLRIYNSDESPVRAWIKPSGTEKWSRPISVAPNSVDGHFHILGCNSVDLLVVRHDDSFIYLPNIKICGLLSRGKLQVRKVDAREGFVNREDGKKDLVFWPRCECAPSPRLVKCCQVARLETSSSEATLLDLKPKCSEVERSCKCESYEVDRHDSAPGDPLPPHPVMPGVDKPPDPPEDGPSR